MTFLEKRAFCRQAGFSLVELMVGLAIGLLTTLVIMQVFSVFEGQKRATTGGADAQVNGTVALYTISRDLQMAGFGLLPTVDTPLKCDPVPTIDHDNNAATPPINITPVIVTDGGAGSDTVTIRYGSSEMGGVPSTITAVVGSAATVDNNLGCRVGDIALLVNGIGCTMTRVTALSVPPDYTSVTLASAAGALGGVNLACLGSWQETVYSIAGDNLMVNGVATIAGIVNLQAQYGISAAANSNQILQWVDATGGTWAAPTVADRNRIKAVRVAVVARSGAMERDDVSAVCSSLSGAAPTGVCAWDATSAAPAVASPAPQVDLSNIADWQRYRYRVFETIIPLRNAIWSWESL